MQIDPLKSAFCGINDLKISNFEIANVVKSQSAFAYAKFSDRRQKDEDEEENKCPCECCNTKCPCCVKLTFCCLAALAG